MHSHNPKVDAARIDYRKMMLVTSAATLSSLIDYSAFMVLLPLIAREFAATDVPVLWFIAAYQIAGMGFALVIGNVASLLGAAKVLRVGLIISIISSFLTFIATNLETLLVARFLQGLAAATIGASVILVIKRGVAEAKLGTGIGLNAAVVAAGTCLGPTAAASVLLFLPWRYVTIIIIPLTIFSITLVSGGRTPSDGSEMARRANLSRLFLQVALNFACFGGVTFGLFILAATNRWPLGLSILALAVALLCFQLLSTIGRRLTLIPLEALSDARIVGPAVRLLVLFTCTNLCLIGLPFLIVSLKVTSVESVGFVMLSWPLIVVLTAPIVGRLSDRMSYSTLTALGLAVCAAGFMLVLIAPEHASGFDMAGRIAVAGMGYTLVQTPNNREIMATISGRSSSQGGSLLVLMRLSGQALGTLGVSLGFSLRENNISVWSYYISITLLLILSLQVCYQHHRR